jgi:hypothetical protein
MVMECATTEEDAKLQKEKGKWNIKSFRLDLAILSLRLWHAHVNTGKYTSDFFFPIANTQTYTKTEINKYPHPLANQLLWKTE